MKKVVVLLMAMISLVCGCFLTKGFAQSARVVNKDTYGAYTKEGMKKFGDVIFTKDQEALSNLVISGQVFTVKKGTKIFLEDISFWDGLIKVRPQGQTKSIWMILEDSDAEKDYSSEKSFPPESSRVMDAKNNSAYRVEGIFYDKLKPAVMIGGKIYFLNDSIRGGKIINISPDKIIIKSQDTEKEYKMGDLITGEIDSVLEYLKKVTPILNSLAEKSKETANLIIQAKTIGNIGEILISGRSMTEIIKQYKQQLLSISIPSSCNTLHSLILESLQAQEDTQTELMKGNFNQARFLHERSREYLDKIKQEIGYLQTKLNQEALE